MVVLLFSLTVHEMSHAWTADQFGDPTARLLGRVSLNPIVHADPIGTVLFPLISMVSGAPLLGASRSRSTCATCVIRAATTCWSPRPARPAISCWRCAALLLVLLPVSPQTLGETNVSVPLAAILSQTMRLNVLLAVFNMIPIPPLDGGNVLAGLLPPSLAETFNRIRPYGFILLYALILSNGFSYIVVPPYLFIMSWLPTQ